jgi:hypothetical protein
MTGTQMGNLALGYIVTNTKYAGTWIVVQVGSGGVWLGQPGYPDGPRCPITDVACWERAERVDAYWERAEGVDG